MTLPALVLVHGGGVAADCWDLTVDEIRRLATELTVLAVDLPGRRGKPGDLRELTIADSVDSVVGDIEKAGLDDIVIVGHSMAGLIVPGVVTKPGASRVREMTLATAFVPPEGAAVVDTITGPDALLARRRAKKGGLGETPRWLVRFAYLNGVAQARRRFMAGKLYPESARIFAENVSRQGMPEEVYRTWIPTTRDRALSVKLQHKGIEAVGGVQRLISIDTCHCLMMSEPERLAEILVERCRLRSS